MLVVCFLLLASAAGSLEFPALHSIGQQLPPLLGAGAFLLLFFGFGVKSGTLPLHIWLPAAHPVAPSNVSALMSGIVIKAGIYGMARVFFDVYGAVPVWAGIAVLVIGVVSALLGVLYALMDHDLKRLLAYHSIENIGIILMGFGSALLFRSFGHPQLAALALIAGLLHTLNHAVFKCLLFLGAGSVLHATHTRNMDELGGLIRRMPSTALYFLIAAIAISGLPPRNASGLAPGRVLVAGNGRLLTPGWLQSGSVSTAMIAVMLIALGTVPLLLWLVWGRKTARFAGPAWACGLPGLTADNAYTATAF